jgi:feruloyl esterase
MASAIARGYATAGTDTGHTGDQMEFGRGHPEKIIDWAYRAVHVAAELGKLVMRNHYGRFPDRAYFSGCSTGGQQALSEAQRFPQDYDGVVAGDPGNNRVALILGFLWSWTATHADDGSLILPNSKLPAIAKAAVDACDAGDGLKDGLISDPLQCRFDPASLLCRGAETDSCLTEPQAGAVKKVYDGAKNRRTGKQIFAGWARGSEQGWPQYITSPREPVRVGLFRYFVYDDPNWHWRTFDWDRDVDFVQTQAAVMNATSVDYRAFRARGGKVLMYTGMADPVVPPGDVISYYDAVTRASGGPSETQKSFRFFPVPGMGHCGGGVGANTFDALGALEAWVERGVAPDRIVASHATDGKIDRTRPLCPYPQIGKYDGKGSIDEEKSFKCVAPLRVIVN